MGTPSSGATLNSSNPLTYRRDDTLAPAMQLAH